MIRFLMWLNAGPLAPGTRHYHAMLRNAGRKRRYFFFATLSLLPLFVFCSWCRIGWLKLSGRKPTLVWGPTPIINIVDQSALMRSLGYDSRTVVYAVYHITNRFDYDLSPLVRNQAIAWWLPNIVFLWSLLKFDVFHYFYDGGLWSGMKIVPEARWIELPLLRMAGKRIVAMAYGSDVRVQHLNRMWHKRNACQECPEPGRHCICDLGPAQTNTKYYREWVNELIAMGDMANYVFSSNRRFFHWPIDTQSVSYVGASRHDGQVVVAHSPNHRYFKGTKYFEQAVANLRAKGYDITLDIIEGVPNTEAKRRYAAADIIAAQCVYGWIGFTEIEGLAAGKPVLTYIRDWDYLSHMPGCPLISAEPTDVEAALERLCQDPDERARIGADSRRWVEQYCSFEARAASYRELHQRIWQHNPLVSTLANKVKDFLRGDSGYRPASDFTGERLGEWSIWSNPFLNLQRIREGCYGQPPLDSDGMIRMYYDGNYVEHPGVVALFALNHFHAHLLEPEDTRHRENFMNAARWLQQKLRLDEDGIARWYYPFDCPSRPTLRAPWYSCFSQSLGLSILMRGHQMEPAEGFDRLLEPAARLFWTDMKDGGVRHVDDGLVFLEEYPEEPASHVLNGFITGLFGLHEYYRFSGDSRAMEVFTHGIETLKTAVGRYEAPDGLRYDLTNDFVVNNDYYYFIVQQFHALHRITGERFFRRYAHKLQKRMYKRRFAAALRFTAPL
ncbi:MAG: D-glucuronyl C5-epimerase family protein [Rhodococcus sp.]|nr:D-glucuronyl C5-epimerase family protein [Rhodococcus sp. (in: high G+C Gram-positive bacteria)]